MRRHRPLRLACRRWLTHSCHECLKYLKASTIYKLQGPVLADATMMECRNNNSSNNDSNNRTFITWIMADICLARGNVWHLGTRFRKTLASLCCRCVKADVGTGGMAALSSTSVVTTHVWLARLSLDWFVWNVCVWPRDLISARKTSIYTQRKRYNDDNDNNNSSSGTDIIRNMGQIT